LATETRGAIARILQSFNPNYARIFVGRERWGTASRADIDVYRRGPEGFLICIEHKIRGGEETFIEERFQTDRLWDDADGRATSLGIDTKNIIAIFLSPDGKDAHNKHFVPLKFVEFSSAVTAAVTETCAKNKLSSTAGASILGLMSFYGKV
jgi:hypothetical protein